MSMKNLSLSYLLVLFISISIFSCKGEDGDIGPAGAVGATGAPGTDGADGVDGESAITYVANGSFSGVVSGLMRDDSEFSEDFELIYENSKSGFEGGEENFSILITRSSGKVEDSYSYLTLGLSGENKGEENMTLNLEYFYFGFEKILDNNKRFKVEFAKWGQQSLEFEASNVAYNSETGVFSFDFVIDGLNNVTGKPVNITGQFTGNVYDEIVRGTEKESIEEAK